MTPFKTIRARAEKRKGGAEALARLLPPKPDPEALRKVRRRPRSRRNEQTGVLGWLRLERDRIQVARLRGGLSRLRAIAPYVRARRVLGQADQRRPHRPQRREDRLGALKRALRLRDRKGAWQLRQVPLDMAAFQRGRAARSVGQAWRAARRLDRPDAAEVPRLRRLRDLEGRGRVSARSRPRHRRSADLETRPRQDPGAVQRLGERDRPPYTHLSRICAFSIGENYQSDRYGGQGDEEEA